MIQTGGNNSCAKCKEIHKNFHSFNYDLINLIAEHSCLARSLLPSDEALPDSDRPLRRNVSIHHARARNPDKISRTNHFLCIGMSVQLDHRKGICSEHVGS